MCPARQHRRLFSGALVLCVIALTAAAPGGCATTHAERQAQAEQHWDQVRARIKLQLARQQFAYGLVDEAVEFVEEALGRDPENTDAYILLANCRLEQGKIAAAYRAIERAAAIDDGSAELWSVRGAVAERMRRYEDARRFYGRARTLDDTTVDYLIAEAECLVVLSQAESARELLADRLIDYDNDPTIHALLGEIALRVGDESAAARSFRAVLTEGHYDPVIAEEYALLAVRLGWYSDALTVLEPILKQHRADVSTSVRRAAATCMLALGRTEDAKMALKELLDQDPDDLQAWYLLAKTGIATGDLPTVRLGAVRARRLAPREPQTLLIDGYASLQEGDLPRAQRALNHLLAVDENDVLAHCLLGLAAERARDLAAARRHYRRALQIDPRCSWARTALASMES